MLLGRVCIKIRIRTVYEKHVRIYLNTLFQLLEYQVLIKTYANFLVRNWPGFLVPGCLTHLLGRLTHKLVTEVIWTPILRWFYPNLGYFDQMLRYTDQMGQAPRDPDPGMTQEFLKCRFRIAKKGKLMMHLPVNKSQTPIWSSYYDLPYLLRPAISKRPSLTSACSLCCWRLRSIAFKRILWTGNMGETEKPVLFLGIV